MLSRKEMTNEKMTTILGADSKLEGDFSAEGSVRIDGSVYGNVQTGGLLVIGAEGSVEGNIEAASVVAGGKVQGNVLASERIELLSTARIFGDISAKIVVIDENAFFQGRCTMLQPCREEEQADQ